MSSWDASPPHTLARGGGDGVAGHLAIDAYVALSSSRLCHELIISYRPLSSEVSTRHPLSVGLIALLLWTSLIVAMGSLILSFSSLWRVQHKDGTSRSMADLPPCK